MSQVEIEKLLDVFIDLLAWKNEAEGRILPGSKAKNYLN